MPKNKLAKISKDIIETKTPKKIIKDVHKLFFEFCRKHDIKYGTPIKKNGKVIGHRVANYEWTIAKYAFLEKMKSDIDFAFFMTNIPEDLKG